MRSHTNFCRIQFFALLIGLLLLSPAQAKKPPMPPGDNGGGTAVFTLVDLGEHQSSAVAVTAPDGAGNVLVAGMSWIDRRPQPVIWNVTSDGIYLPPLHLGLPPSASEASINDMNDAGAVVLRTQGAGAGWYLAPGGAFEQLPGSPGAARAINNFGDIVGDADFTSVGGGWDGAIWMIDNGEFSAPMHLGTFRPNDINDLGLMVGDAYNMTTSRLEAAAAWRDQAGALQVEFLGVLPGTDWSEAVAVSSDGSWIIGSSEWNAFAWSEGTGMIPLGTLGGYDSTALDVNNAGQVVGYSAISGAFSQAAFVWQNGTMFDLNDLAQSGDKPHLSWATAINDAGHIAGIARTSRRDSHEHGYLLIPNSP